jgi:hypothetical protein
MFWNCHVEWYNLDYRTYLHYCGQFMFSKIAVWHHDCLQDGNFLTLIHEMGRLHRRLFPLPPPRRLILLSPVTACLCTSNSCSFLSSEMMPTNSTDEQIHLNEAYSKHINRGCTVLNTAIHLMSSKDNLLGHLQKVKCLHLRFFL